MKMKDFDITMTHYNHGDIITGTIVMIGKSEVTVAIGGLREGVFPVEELEPTFKLGDAILVMVTGKIDDKGCLVMTHAGVNKAIEDREKLKNLKVGGELTFKVSDINNYGLLGDFMGYRVFLPYAQCANKDYLDRDNLKNREITAIVIELDNIKKSIVCSTKILEQANFVPVEVGDIIDGTIIRLENKYAIVLLKNGSKAKLSIGDASYEKIASLSEVVELNHEYSFKILETNTDFSRISVGLKHLMENPLTKLFNELNEGDEVEGEVIKILPVGALIKLTNGLTAMAITRENSDRASVATHHIYKLKNHVKGHISYIDREKHKLHILTNNKKEISA